MNLLDQQEHLKRKLLRANNAPQLTKNLER